MRRSSETSTKRRLVQEWDRSGLTAAEFAEPRGVRPETLRSWGRALRGPLERRSRRRPVARSVEVVEVAAGARVTTVEPRIEVALRGERRLTIFAVWTPGSIAELAAALEAKK